MTVSLVGYALWYYERVVAPRGGFIRKMVNRTLLDLEGGSIDDSEVHLIDAAEAEVAITTAMSPLKEEEPALWKRLVHDLGEATKSGGPLQIVTVRYRKRLPPQRVSVRLAAYRKGGEDIVFWMSKRWVKKR